MQSWIDVCAVHEYYCLVGRSVAVANNNNNDDDDDDDDDE